MSLKVPRARRAGGLPRRRARAAAPRRRARAPRMDALIEHDADILRPPWGAYGRDLTLGLVSGGAKVLLRLLNTLAVAPADLQRYRELTLRREPGVGLLTYCNHTRWGFGRGHERSCVSPTAAGRWRALRAHGTRTPSVARAARLTTPACRAPCCHGRCFGRSMPTARCAGPCAPRTCASRTSCSGVNEGPESGSARIALLGRSACTCGQPSLRAQLRRPFCAHRTLLHLKPLRCLPPATMPPPSQFFANGKTLPVERGSSVHQPVIGTAARLLARGDWLHVFPEGKVQPAGDVGAFRQVRTAATIGRACLCVCWRCCARCALRAARTLLHLR